APMTTSYLRNSTCLFVLTALVSLISGCKKSESGSEPAASSGAPSSSAPAPAPAASAGGGAVTIQVKGSDTMVNLAQAWAEEYKKVAPQVNVEVSGGGSGVGIAALIKGTIDIADASRNMKPTEIEQAKKNTGKDPKEFIVGYDALAIYVHKDNPLNE